MKTNDEMLQVEITIAPARGRKGGQHRSPAVSKVPDPPRILRVARLMALAIKFQDMVDRGEVRDYADIACLGYVSRARVTQIMNLLNLAPDIQERILFAPGSSCFSEHATRAVVTFLLWDDQRRMLRSF